MPPAHRRRSVLPPESTGSPSFSGALSSRSSRGDQSARSSRAAGSRKSSKVRRGADGPPALRRRRTSFVHPRARSRGEDRGSEEQARELRHLKQQLLQKESEHQCALRHIEALEEKHAKELEAAKAENGRSAERIRWLNQKIERIPAFERYVIDILLEFREPGREEAGGDEVATQLVRERAALKDRTAMENLDHLRTRFRSIVARRAEAEQQLHRELQTLRDTVAQLTRQQASADQSCVTLKGAASSARREADSLLSAAQDERDQIKALLERQLEQLKGQVKELTTQLEEEGRRRTRLEEILHQRDSLLMEKEGRLLQIHALERQLGTEANKHRREVEGLRAQGQKLAARLEKESVVKFKMQQEWHDAEHELKEAKKQLRDLKTTASSQYTAQLERKLKEAQTQILGLEERGAMLQSQIATLCKTYSLAPPEGPETIIPSRHSPRAADDAYFRAKVISRRLTLLPPATS